ncbi:ribokinase [Dactylosporangium sp. AC04546]|uniref:ribokinase n=1 Tax=Dactylosporangium sp. AC04546 TaxID=2862460 RepID=UPI001EDE82A1|nr:ribokinase [Dactylosporangium sp. AC04546]WVK88696.1 ribokinase [Dactylosporangium sp. AC04546]
MTATGRTVVVLGSINVDRAVQVDELPRPGQTVHAAAVSLAAGGKSANQAVAAARLGGAVRLVGSVGDDREGAVVLAAVQDAGVDVRRVAVRPGTPTGQAFILVDRAGENCIAVVPGANASVSAEALDAGALAGAGVLTLCLEVADEVVLDAARRARAAGVPVILNASPVRPLDRELLRCVDVLVVNEHELASLTGRTAQDDVDTTLDACGVETLVVTLGARGAALLRRGEPAALRFPGRPVPVADTTGCGDAFLGALAGRLVLGAPLAEAVPVAVAVGAYAAMGTGAQPSYPTSEQLGAFLNRSTRVDWA